MKYWLLILFSTTAMASSSDDCLFFKFCRSTGTSSSSSAPSAATSGSLNPSNISEVRGYGLEFTYQSNNPLQYNFVTGNGKIGALVAPNLENSFFGNRPIEINDLALIRYENEKQYVNKKWSMALGFKVFDKRSIGMDLGFSGKYNPDTQNLNPGIGASLRIGVLRLGVYVYGDDVKLNLGNYYDSYHGQYYSNYYGSSTYQETFSVTTITAGLRFENVMLDFGSLKTQYKFYSSPTEIYLFSSSYIYKKWQFNFAHRIEKSDNYKYINQQLIYRYKYNYNYMAVQYLANKHFLLGVQNNNYLLNEWSAILTIFI